LKVLNISLLDKVRNLNQLFYNSFNVFIDVDDVRLNLFDDFNFGRSRNKLIVIVELINFGFFFVEGD
jgi:hypothetical protein